MCALKWNAWFFSIIQSSVADRRYCFGKIPMWPVSRRTTSERSGAISILEQEESVHKKSERSIIDANNKSWPATLKPCSMPSPSSPTQRWGCRIFANSWQKRFCEEQWQAKVRRISIHFCISWAALSITGPSQLRPALLCPCIGTYKNPRFVVI